jgi:hypothetical protein
MEDWQDRILNGLRSARLLVTFLSPSYFASEICGWEFDEYLKHEAGRMFLSIKLNHPLAFFASMASPIVPDILLVSSSSNSTTNFYLVRRVSRIIPVYGIVLCSKTQDNAVAAYTPSLNCQSLASHMLHKKGSLEDSVPAGCICINGQRSD